MTGLVNVFRLLVKFVGFGLSLAIALSLRRTSDRGRKVPK
jgi:hypothetical protein